MVKVEELSGYLPDMIRWRRDFHRHPELGFQEIRTSSIIRETLESFGVEVIAGFCKTAVIAVVHGEKEGPVIGVRADIDALPMEDVKDVEYRSENQGVCHACGHDAHTAVGLALAKYFQEHKQELAGTVKIVFQPAEEGPAPGGAKLIVESGKVDDVEAMIGYHCYPVPTGDILLCEGVMFASCDAFSVTIEGEGSHAACPHLGRNPIVTASEIIRAYETIIPQEIDPLKTALLAVCSIHAGENGTTNVIPEKVSFAGTLRTLDNEVRQHVLKRMKEIGDAISGMNGTKFTLEMGYGCPVNEDAPIMTECARRAVVETLGEEHLRWAPAPEMGADDFAYYTEKSLSTFIQFGIYNESKKAVYFPHNPQFDIDENAMSVIMATVINTIENYVVTKE